VECGQNDVTEFNSIDIGYKIKGYKTEDGARGVGRRINEYSLEYYIVNNSGYD
jgi:hypothetical protein